MKDLWHKYDAHIKDAYERLSATQPMSDSDVDMAIRAGRVILSIGVAIHLVVGLLMIFFGAEGMGNDQLIAGLIAIIFGSYSVAVGTFKAKNFHRIDKKYFAPAEQEHLDYLNSMMGGAAGITEIIRTWKRSPHPIRLNQVRAVSRYHQAVALGLQTRIEA